jgi:hypothetical protein
MDDREMISFLSGNVERARLVASEASLALHEALQEYALHAAKVHIGQMVKMRNGEVLKIVGTNKGGFLIGRLITKSGNLSHVTRVIHDCDKIVERYSRG